MEAACEKAVFATPEAVAAGVDDFHVGFVSVTVFMPSISPYSLPEVGDAVIRKDYRSAVLAPH